VGTQQERATGKSLCELVLGDTLAPKIKFPNPQDFGATILKTKTSPIPFNKVRYIPPWIFLFLQAQLEFLRAEQVFSLRT
jgi:hypothetical protein